MSEQPYTTQNLAGILAVALGLEPGAKRTHFSGADRQILRRALDSSAAPSTFAELARELESLSADSSTISAARARPAQENLQEFAAEFAKRGATPPAH